MKNKNIGIRKDITRIAYYRTWTDNVWFTKPILYHWAKKAYDHIISKNHVWRKRHPKQKQHLLMAPRSYVRYQQRCFKKKRKCRNKAAYINAAVLFRFKSCTKYYAISSFSIYKNNDAIATAGNTNPTKGTKIDGRYAAAIKKLLRVEVLWILPETFAWGTPLWVSVY